MSCKQICRPDKAQQYQLQTIPCTRQFPNNKSSQLRQTILCTTKILKLRFYSVQRYIIFHLICFLDQKNSNFPVNACFGKKTYTKFVRSTKCVQWTKCAVFHRVIAIMKFLPADSDTGVSSGDGSSGFLLLFGGAFKSDSAIILWLTIFGVRAQIRADTIIDMLNISSFSNLKHNFHR